MSEYVNSFQVNINEIARIKCYDKSQLQINPKEIVEIVMTYEALKILRDNLINIIDQHDAKLAEIKKAN